MLLNAVLPKGTKIALGCLFGCGLFVTVAATLRITLVATVSNLDSPDSLFQLHIRGEKTREKLEIEKVERNRRSC